MWFLDFPHLSFPRKGLLIKPGNSKNDLNLLPLRREKVAVVGGRMRV
jgi:hypothetical protein